MDLDNLISSILGFINKLVLILFLLNKCIIFLFSKFDWHKFFKSLKGQKELFKYTDGKGTGRVCGPYHHHGYEGIEPKESKDKSVHFLLFQVLTCNPLTSLNW